MPEHIRAQPDIRVLRKLPTTHLFNLAFNVHRWFWFLKCVTVGMHHVQYVIGAQQMHWKMTTMMMMQHWLRNEELVWFSRAGNVQWLTPLMNRSVTNSMAPSRTDTYTTANR